MSLSSELDGSYTPNSLRATARGEVRFGARSGSGEVRITSRRIGACPPPRPYTPYSPPDLDAATNMAAPVPPPTLQVPEVRPAAPGNSAR